MRPIEILEHRDVDQLIAKLSALQPAELYEGAGRGLRTTRVAGTEVNGIKIGMEQLTKTISFEQVSIDQITPKLQRFLEAVDTGRLKQDPAVHVVAMAVALHAIHPLADGNKRAIAAFCDELCQDLGLGFRFTDPSTGLPKADFARVIHRMPFIRYDTQPRQPIAGWISEERVGRMHSEGFSIVADIVTGMARAGQWDAGTEPPKPDIYDLETFEARANAVADYHIRNAVSGKIRSVAEAVGAAVDHAIPKQPPSQGRTL